MLEISQLSDEGAMFHKVIDVGACRPGVLLR